MLNKGIIINTLCPSGEIINAELFMRLLKTNYTAPTDVYLGNVAEKLCKNFQEGLLHRDQLMRAIHHCQEVGIRRIIDAETQAQELAIANKTIEELRTKLAKKELELKQAKDQLAGIKSGTKTINPISAPPKSASPLSLFASPSPLSTKKCAPATPICRPEARWAASNETAHLASLILIALSPAVLRSRSRSAHRTDWFAGNSRKLPTWFRSCRSHRRGLRSAP